MTAQLDFLTDLDPPKPVYPTYWERQGRLPEVGDYVTPSCIFFTGDKGLVINGQDFEGKRIYLTGECIRVTERVSEDLWRGVVDMGLVHGAPWSKNGWPVRFARADAELTNRRPEVEP